MTEVQASPVRTVKETFHFRKFADTPANRTDKLPKEPDHSIELELSKTDTGTEQFQRKPETYDLVIPTAAALGIADAKAGVVVEEALLKLMKDACRVLVDAGKTPGPEFTWEAVCAAEHTRITTGVSATTSSGITSDMLKAFSGKFAAYMTAAFPGDAAKQAGTSATVKMINSRFGPAASAPFQKVLPKILGNIESFFVDGLDEGEQEAYAAVLEYLTAQADKIINPPAVDVASMF